MLVKILPRPAYHKVYSNLRVEYGSLDNNFWLSDKKPKKFPAGIAHFLEHKMFDQPTGDAFEQFSHLGADANAFTTYTNTNYLFFKHVSNQRKFVSTITFRSAAIFSTNSC